MIRSILAVIAGSVTWMITALGTDQLILNFFPHWFTAEGKTDKIGVLLLMMLYSLSFSVLGGFVTGILAKRDELKHAFFLGLLQFAMGLMATIQFWDMAPIWYHIIFMGLLIPANMFGGWLRAKQQSQKSQTRLRLA
ncbi:MAG: hypothetical protein AB1757_20190 [Acidobacteriota bacterium]